jgi:CheY-specific phosphatase CheX
MLEFPQPLVNIIEEAITSFASLNGLKLDPNSIGTKNEASGQTDLAGHIGFTGDLLKGSITITCDRELLAATYPVAGMKPSEPELKDWLGEMSNLLLGRTKKILADYGINIFLGTPTIITGKDIHFHGKSAKKYFHFTVDKKPVSVYANFTYDKELTFEKNVQEGGLEEGGALLF